MENTGSELEPHAETLLPTDFVTTKEDDASAPPDGADARKEDNFEVHIVVSSTDIRTCRRTHGHGHGHNTEG